MHLPFRNGAQRVLQWNAEANGFDIAQSLLDGFPVDQAPTRSAFLLQLVKRRHAIAVVVASHPFGEDLNLLRQFMHQLENAPPVVLVLRDCPYAVVGLEKEFFAVVQVEESLEELSQVLQAACQRGMARRRGLRAEDSLGATDSENHLSENSIYQELLRAKQMPIVNISGEVGTGKSLLARLMHQMRGGIDQDCFTFYCGQYENSVVASVEHLLQHSPTANTFVLRDPATGELSRIAKMFAAEGLRAGGATNQLIVLSETQHPLESLYALHLVPLRDRAELIPEIAAGTLTSFANRLGDSQIEIEPAAVVFLQDCNWPGNICELNLALTGALLAQAVNNGLEICLTSKALRAALPFDRGIGGLSRKHLRNRLSEICAAYVRCGWGAGQELRELLNQVLLRNARLAWQTRPREQVQMHEKKNAA